jgi:sugar/nucleoside kinase (ribokinase family)
MFDIITIGSATRDVFLKSEKIKIKKSKESPSGYDECLPLGAKIELKDIVFDTGGGATNAGVTFANLGLKTAAICRIGKDLGGMQVSQMLKDRKISNTFLQHDKKLGTAYSLILLADQGRRSILVYRGASRKIDKNEINWDKVKTGWFYVTSLAGNMDLIKKIWQHAKKNKIKIAWNPGGKELEKGLGQLAPYIKQTAFFSVNTEEAADLTKTQPGDIKGAAKKLKKICQYLTLTAGNKGAYAWYKKTALHAPSLKVKRVNTTGAGDAFGSGFVSGITLKNDLRYAIKMATLNANMVITKMGAKNGLLQKRPANKEINRVKPRKINF